MIYIYIFAAVILALVIRTSLVEYRFHESVKQHEPEIWQAMGAPSMLSRFWVFAKFEKSELFNKISDEKVVALEKKNRQAQQLFIAVFSLGLVSLIIYFNLA